VSLWGSIFAKIMAMVLPFVQVLAANADVVLGDEELSLADYGIPARIIPTSGHSMGSVSVLLETGDAFVGDLAMNGFPLRLGPGLPIFAEDMTKVKKSWRLLWTGEREPSIPLTESLFQRMRFKGPCCERVWQCLLSF
jgi:glyoxylase-like metal-dependent hydrolase (beta-lactamase superfamily II)